MNREHGIGRLKEETDPWDVIVIGGGATGLGCALDAVSRGYRTALIEQADLGNGTSTRSTKLIHGGVRYLRQGNIALVGESLRERGWLMRNAPHLVNPQAFLIPTFSRLENWYYRCGLGAYDLLAGGVALNYVKGNRLLKTNGKVSGIEISDTIGGEKFPYLERSLLMPPGFFPMLCAGRTRSLILDARAAMEAAPAVARHVAAELKRDQAWAESSLESFLAIAKNYVIGDANHERTT